MIYLGYPSWVKFLSKIVYLFHHVSIFTRLKEKLPLKVDVLKITQNSCVDPFYAGRNEDGRVISSPQQLKSRKYSSILH